MCSEEFFENKRMSSMLFTAKSVRLCFLNTLLRILWEITKDVFNQIGKHVHWKNLSCYKHGFTSILDSYNYRPVNIEA